MTLNSNEFVKRLDAISSTNGVQFGQLSTMTNAEHIHQKSVLRYQDYWALSNAFKCLYLETIELFNSIPISNPTAPSPESYSIFLIRMNQCFKSLSGAERLAELGYPFEAYSLIRNIFDHVVLVSAALQNITDFNKIEGILPGDVHDQVASRKLRKRNEMCVRKEMFGNESGLSAGTQRELKRLDDSFDLEVHGSGLSRAVKVVEIVRNGKYSSILPQFEERPFRLFMNRSCEVGWMIHRLIPAIQLLGKHLTDEWANKWIVIDESFEQMVGALTYEFGTPIGAAMVEFVKTKFPFDQGSVFPPDQQNRSAECE